MLQDLSHKTAITRTKPSAPLKALEILYPNTFSAKKKGVYQTLDYGCGKGFDADYYGMDKYDPYYFPEYPTKLYDVVVCNYVLNVVSEQEEANVINRVVSLIKKEGIALFSVRRDLPQEGRMISGYMQRYSIPRDNPFLKPGIIYNMSCVYSNTRGFKIYELDKKGVEMYIRVRGSVNNS